MGNPLPMVQLSDANLTKHHYLMSGSIGILLNDQISCVA